MGPVVDQAATIPSDPLPLEETRSGEMWERGEGRGLPHRCSAGALAPAAV